jgi:2,4-dienoyl-CoA reductase-like NADH-dependent reductase (Old Yellow Enzyme family)/thioredoxin reductase
MSLIKSIVQRRQFLIGTGLASTCALTCKKVAAFMDPALQTSAVMAAEKAAAAGIKAAANKCPHLLSPLRIRNVMLKNRIMHTVSPNYLMQGPENYPSDLWRSHYSNMAKNAAIVSMSTSFGQYPKTYPAKGNANYRWTRISNDKWEDIPPTQNYVDRMIEDIHCEGSLVLFAGNTGGSGGGGGMPGGGAGAPGGMPGGAGGARGDMPGGAAGAPGGMPGGAGMPGGPGGPMGQSNRSVDEIVKEAKEAADNGYDVYQMNTTNAEAVKAVRNATNLIIMSSLRVGGGMGMMGGGGKNAPGVTNVNQPTASEIEQAVEAARQLEGLVDFLWIRDGRHEHPNSYIQDKDKPFNLTYAEAIKKAGIKILTCPSAGFHDPIQNDEFIASGKTDMIGMTTPFFADPDLIEKVSSGRADDVVPCIQCHNCHGISMTAGPLLAVCTVNPKWVAPAYKLGSIKAPATKKKVAVIGGGPAGMKAALVAAERGHKVTLYEKEASLGGLLRTADHSQWRWNHKDFKDYMINQVKKAGIEVKLNTAGTPEMIKAAGYDTVLVATGAEPVVSKMRGAEAGNVFNILTCYSNKQALGKNVVVIGAGKFGTEAAIGMAKDGHKVTVLASGKEMIEPEAVGAHNMSNQEAIYKNHPNFSYFVETAVKSIAGGKVTYADSKGVENSIQADSIVIYSGLKPRMDEAEKFIGSADEVHLLGDCTGQNGTIQTTVRNAFFVASRI